MKKKLRLLTQVDKENMRQKRQAEFDKMTPAEKAKESDKSNWKPNRLNY